MITKRLILIGLSLVLLLSLSLAACTGQEATVTQTATVTATTTAMPEQTALDKIIAAAKKEGAANFFCGGMGADAASIKNGVYKKFGVLLSVTVTPGGAADAYTAMKLDKEAKLPVRYDFMSIGDSSILSDLRPFGLLQETDWAPILEDAGYSMDLFRWVKAPVSSYMTYADLCGWMYNPKLIAEKDLPQKLADVLDPKYKGAFGWNQRGRQNGDYLYLYGYNQDQAASFLRGLRDNGVQFMNPQDVPVKLAAEQINFGLSTTKEYNRVKLADPKAPIAMSFPSDFMHVSESFWGVMGGCKNPNAAILCILWILSPEGQAWLDTVYGAGNGNDPSCPEGGMIAAQKAKGGTVIYPADNEVWLTWSATQDAVAYKQACSDAIAGK